jgi:hypothetical protein
MENSARLSPPAVILLIAALLVAVGTWGWYVLNASNRGPNGEDLSRPAVQPADAYGSRPPAAAPKAPTGTNDGK